MLREGVLRGDCERATAEIKMTATVARFVVGFIFMVFMAIAPGRNCFSLVFLRILFSARQISTGRRSAAEAAGAASVRWQPLGKRHSRSLAHFRGSILSTESSEPAENG
jgi:hypothetical protein